MTETTKSLKPKGSSLLRDLLADRLTQEADLQQLEGEFATAKKRLEQQHTRINESTAVMREAAQTVLETILRDILANEPRWNQQGLVVQGLAMSEEWWKVFFLLSDGKFVQVDPQRAPPGFFWSYDPERKFKGPRSADAEGAFVRWADYLPALDQSKGLLGTVLINPISGEVQVTLTEPMELQVVEKAGPEAPAAAPAPAAPEATPAPATEAAPAA